jgi:hypothetical protein
VPDAVQHPWGNICGFPSNAHPTYKPPPPHQLHYHTQHTLLHPAPMPAYRLTPFFLMLSSTSGGTSVRGLPSGVEPDRPSNLHTDGRYSGVAARQHLILGSDHIAATNGIRLVRPYVPAVLRLQSQLALLQLASSCFCPATSLSAGLLR